jgi:hypothetical protein
MDQTPRISAEGLSCRNLAGPLDRVPPGGVVVGPTECPRVEDLEVRIQVVEDKSNDANGRDEVVAIEMRRAA